MRSPPRKSRRPWRSPRESPQAQFQSELPSRYKYQELHHPHKAMHVNGTAKYADGGMSTPVNSQAVRGNFDLPRWLGKLPQHSPQHLTVRAMNASARPQPVPTIVTTPAGV